MAATTTAAPVRPARLPRKQTPRALAHKWSRNLHSWTSMVSMLLVLFFAATGLTANHGSWVGTPHTQTTTGTLPATAHQGTEWDFLAVSEYVRTTQGVTGNVTDHGTDGTQGRLTYQGPGTESSVYFDTTSGDYTLTTTSYGVIGLVNDLHKGRHTSSLWNAVIDVSAVVLVLVSLTGLVLQLLIERRRRTALVLLTLGIVVAGALLFVSSR